MTKRTVEISSEGLSLSMRRGQLHIKRENVGLGQIPIEDIGLLIVDSDQAVYTNSAVTTLLQHGGVLVLCDDSHLPVGILAPLHGHHLHAERLHCQVNATAPAKKRLWQQIVAAKIRNQAAALPDQPEVAAQLLRIAEKVRSGDPDNREAVAAKLYWKHWLPEQDPPFRRDREGDPPNNLLNYGYMVLRASCSRALVATGLHPALGIKHCNQYNSYALADDLMEPFRPRVDLLVRKLWRDGVRELDRDAKRALLTLLTTTSYLAESKGPFLIAMERMAFSLYQCLSGESKRLAIPMLDELEPADTP